MRRSADPGNGSRPELRSPALIQRTYLPSGRARRAPGSVRSKRPGCSRSKLGNPPLYRDIGRSGTDDESGHLVRQRDPSRRRMRASRTCGNGVALGTRARAATRPGSPRGRCWPVPVGVPLRDRASPRNRPSLIGTNGTGPHLPPPEEPTPAQRRRWLWARPPRERSLPLGLRSSGRSQKEHSDRCA